MTIASPRTDWPPNDSAIRFSGWPSKRSRNTSDQSTTKPQFAGRSGATAMPALRQRHRPSRRRSRAAASLRRRAPAPRRRHGPSTRPSGVSNSSAPRSSQPIQRWRSLNSTPAPSSRRSQARSSGEVLNDFGNTRPLDADERRPGPGPRTRRAPPPAETPRSPRADAASPRHSASRKRVELFAVREIEAAAAGQQEFAAGRRHPVVDGDRARRPAPAPRPPSGRRGRRR